MESVLSAEKFSLLLASFCKVVRSYKSGGSWLVSFLSTDFTVSCPAAFTLAMLQWLPAVVPTWHTIGRKN